MCQLLYFGKRRSGCKWTVWLITFCFCFHRLEYVCDEHISCSDTACFKFVVRLLSPISTVVILSQSAHCFLSFGRVLADLFPTCTFGFVSIDWLFQKVDSAKSSNLTRIVRWSYDAFSALCTRVCGQELYCRSRQSAVCSFCVYSSTHFPFPVSLHGAHGYLFWIYS